MPSLAVLGSQWGDEGKGKIIDYLDGDADLIVRFQGGNNAGHTIVVGDRVFKLHGLPSGVVRPGKLAVIGNGTVVNMEELLEEIRQVEEKLIAGEHPGMSPQDEMLLRRSAKLAGSGHKSMMAPYACPEECLGPVWQALVRNIERRGHILYILILQARTETLHGDALPAEIDEAIRKTLIDVLNTEDIYTRLAQGIYAVIPVNVRREDSLRLLRRMDERFRDLAGGESSFSGRIVRYDELPEFLETYAI